MFKTNADKADTEKAGHKAQFNKLTSILSFKALHIKSKH